MELEKTWKVEGKPPQWGEGSKPKGFRVQLWRCPICGTSVRIYPDRR